MQIKTITVNTWATECKYGLASTCGRMKGSGRTSGSGCEGGAGAGGDAEGVVGGGRIGSHLECPLAPWIAFCNQGCWEQIPCEIWQT